MVVAWRWAAGARPPMTAGAAAPSSSQQCSCQLALCCVATPKQVDPKAAGAGQRLPRRGVVAGVLRTWLQNCSQVAPSLMGTATFRLGFASLTDTKTSRDASCSGGARRREAVGGGAAVAGRSQPCCSRWSLSASVRLHKSLQLASYTLRPGQNRLNRPHHIRGSDAEASGASCHSRAAPGRACVGRATLELQARSDAKVCTRCRKPTLIRWVITCVWQRSGRIGRGTARRNRVHCTRAGALRP